MVTTRRSCLPRIRDDLQSKIVLVTGPHQSGKTTLARSITDDHDYLNYDHAPHRLILKDRSWDRKKRLVVLDELHKMRGWTAWLKGVYDVEGVPPALLVTGSARLDTARKGADSLAGLFFQYRLHPSDVKEVHGAVDPDAALERIVSVSGFPEPFLRSDPRFYGRWKTSHMDVILRQDLLDLETVRDVTAIETLVEMLRGRVGSTVSYASLALHYLRTKDGTEVDLAVFERGRPPLLVEVKHADDSPSPSSSHFALFLPGCARLQLVRAISREKTYPHGMEIPRAATWLASLSL